mmetsp:Transcript_14473/g.25329  ORF Transcript_14473/g.25329 Transcript_14473/m.25329 type:complete len:204 (+) Transcript_14473:155-766(+)
MVREGDWPVACVCVCVCVFVLCFGVSVVPNTRRNACSGGGESAHAPVPPTRSQKRGCAPIRSECDGVCTHADGMPADSPARRRARLLGGGRGARDDLHDLLRDRSLARAVVLARQVGLEGLGVVRRRLHGLHTRSQLRGDRLLQHAEHLTVDVQREDRIENLQRVLLEDLSSEVKCGECATVSECTRRQGEVALAHPPCPSGS